MRVIEKSEMLGRVDHLLELDNASLGPGGINQEGFTSILVSVLRDISQILSGDARLVETSPVQKRNAGD